MSYRLFFWKVVVVTAVIMAFVGSSHIVWAGVQGNKGYIYIRRGDATIKARQRLKAKEARKKAPRARKKKPPKMKWVNIHFDKAKAEIISPNTFKLNRAARLLKINSQKEVLLIGSADRRGTVESNYALGLKRAKAAKRYLINQGIAAARMKVKSIGKKGASKDSGFEAMARDRSVKFQIILAGRKKK